MAKSKAKKKVKKEETPNPNARPLGSILPPEIIRMILQNFADDKESLRACSQTARDFRHVAQSILGRHITVGSARRLKECAKLIKRGAFQHVRSLDLGVDNGDAVAGHYWRYTIVILGGIARYHTLHRLWLSELPFNFPKPNQKENLREAITTLGSTVTELGLYECQFSSYEEMVSLIRSFPLCDFLFIRDCITRKRATGGNMFAGLPAHKLVIKDLQLSASSSDSLLIDISNLIEDAELDVRPLTSLVCDLRTSERSRRVAAAVRESPVEHFQVACTEPGGFQAFMGHFSSSKWALKSLTIGPQFCEMRTGFWVEAFKNLPRLTRVDDVTIVYRCSLYATVDTERWVYFNSVLSRRDLFPALKSVHVRISCGLFARGPEWATVSISLEGIRRRGVALYLPSPSENY